jgi:hypothetical protein
MTDDQAMGGDTSIGADQEMGGGDTDDQAIVGIDPDLSSDDLSGDETAEHGTEGVDPGMSGDEKADARLEELLPRNPSADEPAPGIP